MKQAPGQIEPCLLITDSVGELYLEQRYKTSALPLMSVLFHTSSKSDEEFVELLERGVINWPFHKGRPEVLRTRIVSLYKAQVTSTGLEHLKDLPSLVTVGLNATKFTDADLAHLKVLPKLTTIQLCYNPMITDAGLVHLKALSGVKVLNLVDTKITDDGIKELKKSLPNCQVIK